MTLYRYITVEYFYDAAEPKAAGRKMTFNMMGKTLSGHQAFNSLENLETGKWATATFVLGDTAENKLKDPEESVYLGQFHLYPYGMYTKCNTLTENDVMYIGKMTFYADAPSEAAKNNTPVPEVIPETKPAETKPAETKPAETTGEDLVFNYGTDLCKGEVDHSVNNRTKEVNREFKKDDKTVVKVVPNPGGNTGMGVSLDAYGLAPAKKIDLTLYRYITVEYFYDTAEPRAKGKMGINLMGTTLSGHMAYESYENLETGKWAVATFTLGDYAEKKLKDAVANPYLGQFHLYPYGTNTRCNTLTEGDVMYIGNMTFHVSNPYPDRKYDINFTKGGSGIEGEEIKMQAATGEKIKFPECPFKGDAIQFVGWYIGADTKTIYKPGDEYTVGGTTTFAAMWKDVITYSDVKCLHYPDYYNGVVDGSKYDVVLEAGKDEIGKLEAIKFVPNPDSKNPVYFGFDGWSYGGANIDLNVYKYAAIVYYYKTDKDYGEIIPEIRILRDAIRDENGKGSPFTPGTPLEFGKWSYSLFDLTKYTVVEGKEMLAQMHVLPVGSKNGAVTGLSATDEIYLSKIVFMKEKPTQETFAVHTAFMTGYTDGSFKPNKTMSRAEACTIVTRLLTSENVVKGKYTSKFTDVAKGTWYYDNIAYLENEGLLKSYSGEFKPNQAITRAEFAELVYNMGLAKEDPNNKKTFKDVTEAHPKYAAIMAAASAGIVGGYDDGTFLPDRTITRAQVVKVINNAYGKKLHKVDQMKIFDEAPLYNDVPGDHWAYIDIMEASINHGTAEQSDKGEEWFFAVTPDVKLDYAAGNAKVAELDALEAKRIEEIRAAKDELKIEGTKYYVSYASGNDSNDGKTPATAWKTISKVNSFNFAKGDGVFFNRGEMWREGLRTKQYVSYGAYGEGAKPIITLSPENGAGKEKWSLVEGTSNVWKYHINVKDIGGIVAMKDGKVTFFEKLCMYFDDNGWYPDGLGSKGEQERYKKDEIAKYISTATYLNSKTELLCFTNNMSTDVTSDAYDLLVRCDAGNPGELFDSIEFIAGGSAVISAQSNVTIDNICLMYGSRHGIGAGTVSNLIVTNCEIAWIGGGYQNHKGTTHTRYGNGVEVYGGCDNFQIKDCYVYQCFDAGITNQLQKGGVQDTTEENVFFADNLITDCCYNIEYFMGISDNGTAIRLLKNIEYSDNILRRAGYGFGRGDMPSNAAHIKGWDHYNQAENFVIKNNIFDRSTGILLHIGATSKPWLPAMEGNTYIEHQGRRLAQYGAIPTTQYKYDSATVITVRDVIKDKDAKVYFLEEVQSK